MFAANKTKQKRQRTPKNVRAVLLAEVQLDPVTVHSSLSIWRTVRFVDICVPLEVEGDGIRANVRVENVLEFIVRDGARLVSAAQKTPMKGEGEGEGKGLVRMTWQRAQ